MRRNVKQIIMITNKYRKLIMGLMIRKKNN